MSAPASIRWARRAGGRSVGPRAPQVEPDLAVVGPPEAFLRHGGPQGVASNAFEPVPLIRGYAEPAMEIEAFVTRVCAGRWFVSPTRASPPARLAPTGRWCAQRTAPAYRPSPPRCARSLY